ncbi:uncharacterized protein LOC129614898 [Condylostylus longicornis]|uniref:uncharacterized protein LOC129614898 n=1 Tax=Condylostylus longicornis TaxID=2530218 RepID=UPI00244DCEA6|nr:uncharacterized protein LOC129614898 [Condylostylus longicornis]
MIHLFYIILLSIIWNLDVTFGIWCYRCTSAIPGCGENFNWRGIGYLGDQCPYDQDICVKVIEKKGAQVSYTRDCLSSLNFRTDIPSDQYEGCRPAVRDVRLANYVNHTIKEHDVKRDYYNHVEFCFCFLDHRCNNANIFRSWSTVYLVLFFIVSRKIF